MRAILATGALLSLVPLWLGDSRFLMGLAIGGLVFAAYAVAFNVIFGETKQLFLCVGALAGVGGYLSANFADRAGWPLPASVVAAALIATGLGGLFSWVAVRRSLDVIFTGIVTLAFSLSYANLLLGQRTFTGGENGLAVASGSETAIRGHASAYYLFLAVLLTYLAVYRLLQRSHVGWAFRSLRDDEQAAELAGVNVSRYRIQAGLIGSAMLGLAGALLAHHEGFITPSTYAFGHVDVRVLVMLAFGGIGTLLGPVLGAAVFTITDELLVGVGQLREVAYGLLVIVLFLFFRRGAIPALTSRLRRLRA